MAEGPLDQLRPAPAGRPPGYGPPDRACPRDVGLPGDHEVLRCPAGDACARRQPGISPQPEDDIRGHPHCAQRICVGTIPLRTCRCDRPHRGAAALAMDAAGAGFASLRHIVELRRPDRALSSIRPATARLRRNKRASSRRRAVAWAVSATDSSRKRPRAPKFGRRSKAKPGRFEGPTQLCGRSGNERLVSASWRRQASQSSFAKE
jgi:hypothetical protein